MGIHFYSRYIIFYSTQCCLNFTRMLNFSFTYDKILNAIYIWTDFSYYDQGDEDVARAIYDRFVPASLQKDLNKQITYKEFASMLSLMIAKVDSKLVPLWEKMLHSPSNPIKK